MMVQQTVTAADDEDMHVPWLAGRALRMVQSACLILALAYGALMVLGTPLMVARYQVVVPTGSEVDPGRLTADLADALPQFGLTLPLYAILVVSTLWIGTLISWTVGGVLLWKRPGDPVALCFALACLVLPASSSVLALRGAYRAFTLPLQLLEFISDALLILIWTLFPDGRWVPRWSRWVARIAVPYFAIYAFAIFPDPPDHPLITFTTRVMFPAAFLYLVSIQVYRYRRHATPSQRRQIRWVVFAFCLQMAALLITLPFWLSSSPLTIPLNLLNIALSPATIVAVGLAILRERLFDIDLIINRTLVYGGLTASVAGLYVLIVGGLGALLQAQGSLALSLLATGVVAVLFQPLRERLQRGVSRLLYGRRDEPYAVLAQLGRQLEASGAPAQILAPLAATLGRLLRLPYVAITTADEMPMGVYSVVDQARNTPAVDTTARVQLTYQGRLVGTLRLLPRLGEPRLSKADRRLLDDLTPHLGVAVHAAQVTAEVQRARARIVSAREEERRRLRRELHDGLGPQLASQALTLDLAVRLLRADPGQAEALLTGVREQSQEAVSVIRELIYGLRPPALDDLGLLGAIRAVAERLAPDSEKLQIQVQALDDLPTLPAAVEVAAYRIAQEALTNVARHAHARSCRVRLSLEETASGGDDGALCLEIIDDGVGIAPERASGVGLRSMRERAVELGGHLTVERASAGGTLVRTILPLPTMEGAV